MDGIKKKLSSLINDLIEKHSCENAPSSASTLYLERRNIMLLHKAGIPASLISWYINRDVSTVLRWIPRVEKNIFNDMKRSGRPPIFTREMQLKTIGFYCQQPPAPGCSHWVPTRTQTARRQSPVSPYSSNPVRN